MVRAARSAQRGASAKRTGLLCSAKKSTHLPFDRAVTHKKCAQGCTSSKPSAKVLPPTISNGVLTSVTPSEYSDSNAGAPAPASAATPTTLTQGHHWAEGSPGRERRIASKPWDASVLESGACVPCDAAANGNFEFNCTFPMMVMKMSTFMSLDKMKPYEEMIQNESVFEWKQEMGKVFFLSHQWTSFSHPDPEAEQLKTAQGFLGKVAEGKIKSLFATEEEWLAFHYKETNRFLQFDPVTEEQMAGDVQDGYVWLDYASVPQAADPAAEEQRLRAIDSIPFYVDHALCFMAIVPKVEHKDLKGTFCTYKSWMERGWCRLETQVHELRLFEQQPGEIMPGVPKFDLPRRPLIVHSENYATTYDM